jgi:hypothetical protein
MEIVESKIGLEKMFGTEVRLLLILLALLPTDFRHSEGSDFFGSGFSDSRDNPK